MTHGFIYLLDNESMPDLIKIGFTTRHPAERVRELSRATACPTAFRLLAWFGHSETEWAEARIHKEMSAFRVNDNREFFRMTYREAQELVRRWGDPFDDVMFTSALDRLADIEHTDEWLDAISGKVAA